MLTPYFTVEFNKSCQKLANSLILISGRLSIAKSPIKSAKLIDLLPPPLQSMWVVFLFGYSLIFVLQITAAHADEKDTLNFIAGVSRQHDSNLFRQPSSETSDNITNTYAGIRIDKQYSLQRFKFDYTHTQYQYQNNDYLDFGANDYKAAWLWAMTPYLTGTLSAERKQQLNDFKDYQNTSIQNIRTTENQRFEADLSPHGNWHLLGGLTRTEQTNSQTFNEESDFKMTSLDTGVKYVYRSGTAMTFMLHDRNGEYKKRQLDAFNLYDTGFDESEVEGRLDWAVTGKSKINARIAYVKREHDNFSQRDYSGEQGSLKYTWEPTGKLQLVSMLARQFSNYQTGYSNYARVDSLSLSPVYAISAKITAHAMASISERTFLGQGPSPSSGRVDKERLANIGIDWAPYRSVSIGASLQRSSRNSNFSVRDLDFTDTTAGLSASLYF